MKPVISWSEQPAGDGPSIFVGAVLGQTYFIIVPFGRRYYLRKASSGKYLATRHELSLLQSMAEEFVPELVRLAAL